MFNVRVPRLRSARPDLRLRQQTETDEPLCTAQPLWSPFIYMDMRMNNVRMRFPFACNCTNVTTPPLSIQMVMQGSYGGQGHPETSLSP